MKNIPVLMYHHVKPNKDMVSITPKNFEEQISTLNKMKFHFYSIDEFIDVINGTAKIKKGVLITFDDGFVDNWIWAYPILKKYNAKATIFITPKRMPKHGIRDDSFKPAPHRSFARLPDISQEFISLEEMQLMSELIDFQSHTMTHLRCTQQTNQTKAEIKESKLYIEQLTNKPCKAFAWPYGDNNQEDLQYLAKQGYQAIFTIKTGTYRYNSNPLDIKRIEMKDKGKNFIKSRMFLYTTPILSQLYAFIKGKI